MIELQISGAPLAAIVDDADADLASSKWYVKKRGYVYRFTGRVKNEKEYLHRIVLTRKIGRVPLRTELTDHRDRNKLNNSRENLRIATRAQNATNSKARASKSGFRGVSLHASGLWSCRIRTPGKVVSLGYFDEPAVAAVAYDAAAVALHGEFATTNQSLGLLP